MPNNKINTHDILTGEFLDCEAFVFLNQWWDKETPKWPGHEFFNELLNDIKSNKPQNFSLTVFNCRRYKTDQLLTSLSFGMVEYIRKATIFFKTDNSFWWIKENGIQKINEGRLLISLETDWIAHDWMLAEQMSATWIFDSKPLDMDDIRLLEDSCFLCPNNDNSDTYIVPDDGNVVQVRGKYRVRYLQSPADSRWKRFWHGERVWTTTHDGVSNAIIVGEPWKTNYWMCDTEEGGNTLASFLLPVESEINGERAVNINQRIYNENKLTRHFLKRHGVYTIKVLGEERGKVYGINPDLNENFSAYVRGTFYNWDLAIHMRDSIFTNTFLLSEANGDKETANWLAVVGNTLLTGAQIALAIASSGTTAAVSGLSAARSGMKTVNSWANALNGTKHSVSVDEITNWLYSKANNQLIEVQPEIPNNFQWSYCNKVNWHILHGYFPLNNDPALTSIGNIGWIAGPVHQVFSGKNINGWVKLSDKCIIDGAENKCLNFLKKNNVFIYSKPGTQPEKVYLKGSGGSVPWTWVQLPGGTTGHIPIPGEPTVIPVRREHTFVYTFAAYSGSWPPSPRGGIEVNPHNETSPVGPYYQLYYANASPSDMLEWGMDNQNGTTYIKYPRGSFEETVRLDKTSPSDWFRLKCELNRWYVELVKRHTPPPTQVPIPPSNIPPPKNIVIPGVIPKPPNPPGGGGNPPRPSFPGGGGDPPPPPNVIIPTIPTQIPDGRTPGLPVQGIRGITQLPQQSGISNIQKDPLGIQGLRQQQQQRIQQQQQQQQRIKGPAGKQGHTQIVPPTGQRVPGEGLPDQIPGEPGKVKTPGNKKKITE